LRAGADCGRGGNGRGGGRGDDERAGSHGSFPGQRTLMV
jgi:hypothetical protein